MGSKHSALITGENWTPGLALDWSRPEYSAVDGLGPLDTLYQAGDSIVAIGAFVDEHYSPIGTGVMVAPGLMLTATHVLDEYPRDGPGPAGVTFLPDGHARVWLPTQTNTLTNRREFIGFGSHATRRTSDLSLVPCVLMSEAHASYPLKLSQIQIELPLPGQRLWAIGFRRGDEAADDDGNSLRPLVSSGLVTACFPHGRDRLLASPCIEVAMNTVGGMSGGPVLNEDGRVVGIVSTSFEGEGDTYGPTYVTLLWDALRMGFQSTWPRGTWPEEDIGLLEARDRGLARVKGDVTMDEGRNLRIVVGPEAAKIIVETAPNDKSK